MRLGDLAKEPHYPISHRQSTKDTNMKLRLNLPSLLSVA